MEPVSGSFAPQLIRGVLPADTFRYVELVIGRMWRQVEKTPYSDPEFRRHVAHDPVVLQSVHEELRPIVSERLKKPIKRTYNYVSLYGPEGICHPHTDRRHCEYTVSLCVSQKRPWPLFVADSEYLLAENDGLLFNGTKQLHYRPRIAPDNFCHVILFHFVDQEFKD
jgi:hypothetical protein